MAKLDSAKEEIGWLKVEFAACAAVDASLIAWAAQGYDTAKAMALMLAGIGIAVLSWTLFRVHRLAYRRIREVEML